MDIKSKKTKYQILFVIITIVMAIRCCGVELATSLTTSLSFSYANGFTNRGLVGTIYQLITSNLLGQKLSYSSAFTFSGIVMIIVLILFCVLGCTIIKWLTEQQVDIGYVLLIVFTIFSASIITGVDYIGSAETLMLIITLVDVMCIVRDVNIVPIIILPILGMLAGSEYFFAFMGCVIITLIMKMHHSNSSKMKAALIINIIETVGLYIYLLIAQPSIGSEYIRSLATQLNPDDKIKQGLLQYYMYGITAAWEGFPNITVAILRVVVSLILLVPFIVLLYVVYKKIFIKVQEPHTRLLYRLWIWSGVWITPLFLISNNYGTWIYAIIAYYLITIMAFILMQDEVVIEIIQEMKNGFFSKYKWIGVILILYAILFTPIDSVKVGTFVDNFVNW